MGRDAGLSQIVAEAGAVVAVVRAARFLAVLVEYALAERDMRRLPLSTLTKHNFRQARHWQARHSQPSTSRPCQPCPAPVSRIWRQAIGWMEAAT